MTIAKTVLLGVVQGLTEFLPVSSSGHLVLLQSLFGLTGAEEALALDVALHFGTLLAVIVYFARDLGQMAADAFSWVRRKEDRRYEKGRLLAMLAIATLPAVVVGLGFKEVIERWFVSPKVAGIGLFVTGTVLWLTKRCRRSPGRLTPFSAFLVGCAQAVAITPGISRSGSTIAAGLFCGLDRPLAARFSFLMAIPAILGSTVLESRYLAGLGPADLAAVLGGTFASAVVGFLAIRWMMGFVGRGRLHYFGYYCWVVGFLSLLLV